MVRAMRFLFKICTRGEWAAAAANGAYTGSAVDQRDGFIHFSAEDQMRETAARHFAGQSDLVLVAFAEEDLPDLRWEPSRGGALFPHVYGVIPVTAAAWVKDLPLEAGVHRFPESPPA
jgi:uncharacterized protein (DUF952 family)